MSGREQGGQHAVPLAEAAARLGLSPDALRMRIRRGKAKGFKRGRQVYVWLQDEPPGAPVAATAGSKPKSPSAPARGPRGPWAEMVELQKQEIARLIQETDRLNVRLDRHLNEVREMRQMLQREQVLRQQEQSLRRDIQALLDRLISYPAFMGTRLTAPEPPPPAGSESAGGHEVAGREKMPLAEMLRDIGQSLRDMETRDPAGAGGPGHGPGDSQDEP